MFSDLRIYYEVAYRLLLGLFYCSLFTFYCSHASGQATWKGRVVGINNEPIISANVQLLDNNDKVLGLTYTDSQGRWNFVNKLNAVKAVISHLGYAHKTIYLVNYKIDQEIVTVLQEQTIELETITIASQRAPIKVKGDTTIYDPQYFKLQFDQSLGDILSRIPEFELDDGRMMYKGSALNELLIDNYDIFNQNSDDYQKQISVDVIDKIEVVKKENEEGRVLYSLNVKVNNSHKNKILGNVLLATNLKNSDFQLNPYLLGNKLSVRLGGKGMINSKYQNLILDAYQDAELLYSQGDNAVAALPFSMLMKNNVSVGLKNSWLYSQNLNLDYRLHQNIKVKFYASAGEIQQSNNYDAEIIDLITSSSISFMAKSNVNVKQYSSSLNLEYTKGTSFLRFKSPITLYKDINNDNNYSLLQDTLGSLVSKFNNIDFHPKLDGGIDLKNKIKIWGWASFYMGDNNSLMDLYIYDSAFPYKYTQEVKLKEQEFNAYINGSKKIDNFSFGLTCFYYRYNATWENINTAERYKNITLNTEKVDIGSFIRYGKKYFSLGLSIKYPILFARNLNNQNNLIKKYPIIELNPRYDNNKIILFSKISNAISLPDLLGMDSIYFRSNMNNAYSGSLSPYLISKGLKANVGFIAKDETNYLFNINLSFAKNSNEPTLLNTLNENMLHNIWVASDQSSTYSTTIIFKKRLSGIKLNYKVQAFYVFSSRIVLGTNQHIYRVNPAFSVSSFYGKGIDFNVQYLPTYFSSKFGMFRNKYFISSINAEVKLNYRSYYFKGSTTLTFSKRIEQGNFNPVLNIDLGKNFTKQKIQIFVRGIDILYLLPRKITMFNAYQSNLEVLNYRELAGYFQLGFSFLR